MDDMEGAMRTNRLYPWLYLLAITAAELLIAVGRSWAGVLVHVVILIVLIVHASMGDARSWRFYLALMLMPLIRLLSLVLPMNNIPMLYRYLAVSVPLFLAAFSVAGLCGYRLRDIGLRLGRWYAQLLIALVGIPMGVMEYYILRPKALVPDFRLPALVVPALVLLVSTGFLEELIFRGILLKATSTMMGVGRAVFFVSLVFAAMHITHQSWIDEIFVFAVALFFGWVVVRSKSLVGVTLAHGLNNIILYLVLPFFPAVAGNVGLWLRGLGRL